MNAVEVRCPVDSRRLFARIRDAKIVEGNLLPEMAEFADWLAHQDEKAREQAAAIRELDTQAMDLPYLGRQWKRWPR